ncbi:MAG: MATE family efflux transporter [Colwellia sp.]|nr:MATE family efflux transporter [Colwellia sp.]MCW9082380.1 MATE family efflux transporter [Colwellia sp.]
MLKIADLDQHKQLLLLAFPMILSNITVPLLGLVDTAVIGHLPYAYFLGGSTIGAMIVTSITWLCGFLRMSTTGLSAQAYGINNIHQNLLVLLRGIIVAFAIGFSFVIVQSPFINLALDLAGGSEQVQFYARQYSEIRIWGLPAALANLVILGWLLGNHKTKAVMWLLIITNLVNVCLDLLFVFGFHWQVQGVASATIIAEYSGMILGLLVVLSHYKTAVRQLFNQSQLLFTSLFERVSLLSYFKLNRDILIRTLCLELCFIFITFQGAKLGDEVVAANAILMNFLLLISFGLDGVANATEAMVGKAYGEKNNSKLQTAVKVALFWTVMFALCYSLLFMVAGEYLLALISNIESVINFAKDYMVWMILLPIVACWCFLFDGVYIGLMKAKAMRNSMIVATFAGFFPMWILLQDYGNHGLWAALLFFMLLRGVTLAWHYKYYITSKFNLDLASS